METIQAYLPLNHVHKFSKISSSQGCQVHSPRTIVDSNVERKHFKHLLSSRHNKRVRNMHGMNRLQCEKQDLHTNYSKENSRRRLNLVQLLLGGISYGLKANLTTDQTRCLYTRQDITHRNT